MLKCPKCKKEFYPFMRFFRLGNYDLKCRRCGYKMNIIKSPNATMIAVFAVLLFLLQLIMIILPPSKYEKLLSLSIILVSFAILFYVNVKDTEVL